VTKSVKKVKPHPDLGGGRDALVECSISTKFDHLIEDLFEESPMNCSAAVVFASPLKRSLPLCDWDMCHGQLFSLLHKSRKGRYALEGVRELPETYQLCVSIRGEPVCVELETSNYIVAYRRLLNYFAAQISYRTGYTGPLAPISAFNAFAALFKNGKRLPSEGFRYMLNVPRLSIDVFNL